MNMPQNIGILFEQFYRCPSVLSLFIESLLQLLDFFFYFTAVFNQRNQILRRLLSRLNNTIKKFVNTLLFISYRLNYFNFEQHGKFFNIEDKPFLSGDIAHIERQYQRNIKLHKLNGKIKTSFNICRIDNINHDIGFLLDNE